MRSSKTLKRKIQFEIEPWAHQREAINRARDSHSFGLFFEMGCGKTATAINILRERYQEAGHILRTLIFCPPIVIKNWIHEFYQHSRIGGAVINLSGSGKKRIKTFSSKTSFSSHRIFVTNYESLLMSDLYDLFQKWRPQCVVFDESHKLKDSKAKRSKLAAKLTAHRPFVLLLSGSPILNSPLDIYHQYKCMDGGSTFGTSFYKFRALYFADRNAWMRHAGRSYFPKWEYKTKEQDGLDSLAAINALMNKSSMRVKKEDCLDLPPLVRETRFVGMTPEQSRLYKEMKRDFVTYLDSKACVATLAITKALRLMQLASGYVQTEEGAVSLKNTPKQEALKELLEQLTPNHKVLIWAVWKENYSQIRKVCEDFKVPYVEVHGDITPIQKDNAVTRFNTDPEVRVFLGNPGAGGIGLNLVASDYSIFYSRNFSLEHSIQAEARNHRGGSEIHKKVTRIDLITEGTIDELITERLLNKQKISEKVLRSIREGI